MHPAKFSLWRLHSSILTKAVSLAIVVSFVVSPMSSAFAQDVGSDTSPGDTGASTPPADTTPPPDDGFSIPGVDMTTPPSGDTGAGEDTGPASVPDTSASPTDTPAPTDTTEPTDNTDQPEQTESLSSFGDGSPTILNPGVFTGQNYSHVSGASGAFTQNIQIDIPPGRNGLQPNVALQYNNQSGQDSIVGYGWTISIPYIQRFNKLGSQNLYGANSTGQYFTSSIDGELATTSSATSTISFRAKVDDGGFNSYTFQNNVWTMYDKKGTRYLFGAADNSQQNASASSTQIYKWMLQEIRDTNNNFVRYVYTKDSGEIYPSQILYTGNGGTDGAFTIDFTKVVRSSPTDPYISFAPGFKVTTNYRISKITASVSGTIVREYNLSYTAGNNGARSLLSTVQENGWDANHQNQVTYPATSFAYTSNTGAFVGPGASSVHSSARVIADVNGNSINDVSSWVFGGPNPHLAYIGLDNSGSGPAPFNVPQYWSDTIGNCLNFVPRDHGVRLVDTNADGKADAAIGDWDASNGVWFDNNYWLNSPTLSWNATTTTGVIPQFSITKPGVGAFTSGLLGDVNGDGLPDYEQAIGGIGGTGITDGAYLGNGSLWDAATTSVFNPAKSMPTSAATVTNSQLVDINGDGLQDWIYSDTTNTYVLLNTGSGWEGTPDAHWTFATSTLYSNSGIYYDRGIRFVDINGDGLPDIVRSFENKTSENSNDEVADYKAVWLNTGLGWATSTGVYTLPAYITQGNATAGQCFDEFANWTGNGQEAQDIIAAVTYPQGGTATISYVKTASGGNANLPYSLLVVSGITNNDGLGTSATKSYTYNGGLQYLTQGVRNRKFAGFANVVESDANTDTTTYFDQGDTIDTANGEQNDGYGQINHPFRIDVRKHSDNSLMRQTFNRWDTAATFAGNTTFAFLGRQVVQDYGTNGSSHRDSATDYTYSTATGDLTEARQFGEVTGGSNGLFTDIEGDSRVTQYTYAASTSVNLSLPVEKQTFNVSFGTTSATTTAVSVLVVGGGGGGGPFNTNAGGGGGGVVYQTSYTISAQAYSITIGAGGLHRAHTGLDGTNGGDSTFSTLTAVGGGAGKTGGNGSSGGSGAGGGGNGSTGGTGTAGQGNSGGNGATGGGGGGGGGAAVGTNASANNGGVGGAGVANSISGSSVIYGGGGGGEGATTDGTGGAGGGGSAPGGQGTNGLGGGGGGGYNDLDERGGGDGVIIISAPSGVISTSTGGALTTSGGNDIWTFNVSQTWTPTIGSSISTTTLIRATDEKYYYDGIAFGSVGKGNQTKVEKLISGTSYSSTTKSYDGTYGLVTQQRDPNYKLTMYTLDANNLYVATSTNPLSQTKGYAYDYSTGKVKSTFDENNRLYSTSYDGLGRPLTINIPDPSSGTSVTKTTFSYNDSGTPGATYVLQTDNLSSSTSTTAYTYQDGLARKFQERRVAEGNNTYAVKDWTYNNVGLMASEGSPYFASSTARSSATTTSQLFTTYAYDALQRVATITNSVGSTSNAYDAWTVTTTDANGKVKDYTKDTFGNLAKVVEHISGAYATTTYTWNINNALTKIIDASGNVRNFTYDSLARRLTAEDLHASTDVAFGTSTYAYDAVGNLTSTTDAKGQTINYTYDPLNRKATEDYTGGSGTEITYTYDTCNDGKGRLCVASSTAGRVLYNYNPLGLQSSASSTLNGTTTAFVTQYSYDRQGNQSLITNPDNSQIQNNYNGAGLLDAVLEKENGGSFSYIQRNIDYSPMGQPKLSVAGNWATTTNAYNQNALYRLTSKITQLPSGSRAQDLSYSYDALGNITQLVDAGTTGTAKTIIYTYDDLSRMLTASTTNASSSPYKYTYTYDVLGDIMSGPLGAYAYAGTTTSNYANPHAPTKVASKTLTYDQNGNLTAEGTTTYTWDYRNRITQSGNGIATSTYSYDDQDNRIKLTEGSTTTFFPSTLYNAITNATTTKHIFGNGMLFATLETAASSTSSGGLLSTSTIAFDATSTSITTSTNGTTTKTWTHTLSGTNPIIVLTADISQNIAGTGSIASASWNGGAFTKATSTRRNNVEAEVWYLVATTTGAKTMSVTINGTTTSIMLGAQSFTGVSTSSPFEMATSSNGSGGTPVVSITPANATDVLVSTLSKSGGGSGSGGGGTSTSTPAHVQSTKAHDATSVSFASPVTTGNLVVVGITVFSQTLGANNITDNKGNTYTKIAEAINGSDHAAIYYAKNVTGGSSFQVNSVADGTIAIHEYSGVSTSSNVVNATSTRFGTSNKPSTWAATSTVGNDLFFSVAWSQNNGDTWTAGNGYTIRQSETDNNTFERIATEDQIIANASSSVAWYSVTTSDLYAAALAAFRPQVTAGGGGGSSFTSADATSSEATLWKNATTSFFGGASYKIATTSGTITDTYTTATSTNWVMVSIALRPATSTSSGGGSGTGSTTLRYVHTDNLAGSSVITDASGAVAESLDYYPYGGQRIDAKSGGYGGEKRKYDGTEYDSVSGLNYMMARYQSPTRGQFLSEDQTHLVIGNPGQVRQLTGQDMQTYLSDPQLLNSYSYARGNPIVNKDPNGLSPFDGPNTPGSAMAKQYLIPQLQAAGDGAYAAAKTTVAVGASVALVSFAPQTTTYVLGGWASALGSINEDIQSGTVDTSGRAYLTDFAVGAAGARFTQGGGYASVVAKSALYNYGTNYAMNGGQVSRSSVVSQTAGSLAGRITQTAMLYAAGSPTNSLLNQLAQAVASLAVQVASYNSSNSNSSQSSGKK